MNCTKCGKTVNPGDAFCSGCGTKVTPQTNHSGTWLLVIVLAIVFTGVKGCLFDREDKVSQSTKENAGQVDVFTFPREESTQSSSFIPEAAKGYAANMIPTTPGPYDILEDSEYNNGMLRRRVSTDTNMTCVTDYWANGTLLRSSTFYYSNGAFQSSRITNYDNYGNPTDTTEMMANGDLWLYLYYANVYDLDGRPVMLAEYNRFGYPLYSYEYVYHDNGTYTRIYNQYRGFVYESDLEYIPDGSTSIFMRVTSVFDAYGNLISEQVEEFSI